MILSFLKNKFRFSSLYYNLYLKFFNKKYYKLLKNDFFFYSEILPKNILIFDIGANRGDKSYIFNFFSKKLICYEPEESLYKLLKVRFKKNYNIKINNFLISDTLNHKKFYSVQNDEAYSSTNFKSLKSLNILNNKKIFLKKLKSSTLNSEINKYGTPYYVKIDVEGGEKNILKNLKFKIPLISFEANLPFFIKETEFIINKLSKKYQYTYNIRLENKNNLKYKNFQNARNIISYIGKIKEKNGCEIFCKLIE